MRGRAAAAPLVVLAVGLQIGCTQVPHDLGDMIGPPQKRFEGEPAHGALAPEPPAPVANALPEPASPARSALRPPVNDLRELIGLERQQLQARLGDPALRRRDAPAEIWQYRSTDCVLDLFLYRSAGRYRVAYAEVHDRGAAAVSPSSCYAGLLARHPRLDESRL